jgi:dihydropteroate synthase
MGIVNAAPDSFSDGGMFETLEARLNHAHRLVSEGAHIIDVGGESGRTDRPQISPDEEAERVVPLVSRLAHQGVLVSVDTWKPEVASEALRAGAVMINDVSGLSQPRIARLCAASGAALVVMHTRAKPKQKLFPAYDDMLEDVFGFLSQRIELATEEGVLREQLVVDPGLDFAKTPAETVSLLRRIDEFSSFCRPVLLAVSRKDFLGALTQRKPRERLGGTLATVGALRGRVSGIVRVHDVAQVADFLSVGAALNGEVDIAPDLALDMELRHEASR